ncbi:MAG TPA: DUF1611 domain-containing protein [Panacibacter sp.]|nr:DUF1611 domain-containing protein [Panacibacter sp.]HNP44719.1 DUF1611 domain-containing protein [Panacibacter sp.]
MKPKAIVITNGFLDVTDAKTAHGLIRGTDRFTIAAVIDPVHAGKDAGEVLDGKHRSIPVFATATEVMDAISDIQYCIIGVATHGGVLPPEFISIIEECIQHRISIVNGLHECLTEHANIVALAKQYDVELIDIRRPKKRSELHFWHGDINKVDVPVIAVLGMDCAMGKRTTCRMVMQACAAENIKAEMIYTGQTGWLQGGEYGFIFDTTLNDFISGEIEHAVVTCWKEAKPDVIMIEGQSALRNPSGPCGSEFLVSGNARYTILVHAPKRVYFDHAPEWGKIAPVQSEIDLIAMYGSQVIAVALNTEMCTEEEAFTFQKQYEEALGIPVLLPIQEGVSKIVPVIKSLAGE